MNVIFADPLSFDEETVFDGIKATSSFIDALDEGSVRKVKCALSDYKTELKESAVKLGVCPECGNTLKWNFKGNENGDRLVSFVKCVACGFKEVC